MEKKILDHPCFLQFLIMQSSTNSCVYHVTKTDCLKAVFGSTIAIDVRTFGYYQENHGTWLDISS